MGTNSRRMKNAITILNQWRLCHIFFLHSIQGESKHRYSKNKQNTTERKSRINKAKAEN